MPHRLSIAGLLAVILVCGIGFAALRSPSSWSVGALLALTMALLATAVLCVLIGRNKPFWAGFAVFGAFYLVFTVALAAGQGEEIHPVNRLLLPLYTTLHPDAPPPLPPGTGFSGKPPATPEVQDAFLLTGHSLACLICALVGAMLGRALAPADPQVARDP